MYPVLSASCCLIEWLNCDKIFSIAIAFVWSSSSDDKESEWFWGGKIADYATVNLKKQWLYRIEGLLVSISILDCYKKFFKRIIMFL